MRFEEAGDVERRIGGEQGANAGPGERRLEFAVIGDTVNVASRLESKTKELNTDIVVSAAAMERAAKEPATHRPISAPQNIIGSGLRGR